MLKAEILLATFTIILRKLWRYSYVFSCENKYLKTWKFLNKNQYKSYEIRVISYLFNLSFEKDLIIEKYFSLPRRRTSGFSGMVRPRADGTLYRRRDDHRREPSPKRRVLPWQRYILQVSFAYFEHWNYDVDILQICLRVQGNRLQRHDLSEGPGKGQWLLSKVQENTRSCYLSSSVEGL